MNAGQDASVVITLGQFEEEFRALPSERAFIFARYKGRWVPVIAEFNRGNIKYFFFNEPQTALLSECILMVSVPQKPSEL